MSIKREKLDFFKIKNLKIKKEYFFGFLFIFILFISNLGLYFYFNEVSNAIQISVPQTGYYLDGYKTMHVGVNYPLPRTGEETSIRIMIYNDNTIVYNKFFDYDGLNTIEWKYNNKYYYSMDFSNFGDSSQIITEFNHHLRHKDTDGPLFTVFKNPFNENGFRTLMTFLNVQRSGVEIEGWHEADHLDDGQDIGVNLTGGWFDAGDYNKYSFNTAYTIYNLLEAYNLTRNSIDIDQNGVPDLLDEAKWGLDWLLKMQDSDGGIYNKIFSGFDYWGMPSEEIEPRTTNTSKYSGTAAAFSAVTALGSKIFEPYYASFAANLLSKSQDAFNWITNNPIIFQDFQFGEYPGNNHTIGWAAAELFRSTGNSLYLNHAQNFLNYTSINVNYTSDWDQNNLLGLYALMSKVDGSFQDNIIDFLNNTHNNIIHGIANNVFMVPHNQQEGWGINTDILNYFRDSYYLYNYTGQKTLLHDCIRSFNWIVGDNPWSKSFITGLGYDYIENPYTRLEIEIPGGVVPGPVCYAANHTYYEDTNDNRDEGWKYNEYTINANSEAILCYTLLMNITDFQTTREF